MNDPWRGPRTRGHRHRGWPRAARAIVCLALGLGSGCEFRDEPVRPATRPAFWPTAAGGAADGAAGDMEPDSTRVEYVAGYAAAARRAAAEGRPLLVVFGAEWCRWSGELARGPLADRDVVARTRRFVCAFIDADRDPATCSTFGVSAFPTVVVLDTDGRERFRATGSGATGGFVAALDAVPDAGGKARRLADDRPQSGAGKDITR